MQSIKSLKTKSVFQFNEFEWICSGKHGHLPAANWCFYGNSLNFTSEHSCWFNRLAHVKQKTGTASTQRLTKTKQAQIKVEIKMASLTLLQHVSSNKVHKVKVDEKVKGSCVRLCFVGSLGSSISDLDNRSIFNAWGSFHPSFKQSGSQQNVTLMCYWKKRFSLGNSRKGPLEPSVDPFLKSDLNYPPPPSLWEK